MYKNKKFIKIFVQLNNMVNNMVNLYRRGRISEKKVLNRLSELGWYNLVRSKGSKGPWDIRGRTPRGYKGYVQVKSHSARASTEEIRRLRNYAKKHGGVAILAHYDGSGKIKFRFLGNWARR